MENPFTIFTRYQSKPEGQKPETPQERVARLMAADPAVASEVQLVRNINDNVKAGNSAQGDVEKLQSNLHDLNAHLQQKGEKPVTLEDLESLDQAA